jgi:hypothetical protein
MDLTPVGLSKDGKRLVLVSARGEEYFVPVDHRLRAALRGDHARLGQLEMTMETTLRPRDIQARVRAGESAEDLAAATQTTVDKIMVYAGPVLAERAHIAQVAQASSVRRRPGDADGGTAAARTLQEAALQHLRSIGLRDDDVSWDAWRRDDGRWALVAEYVSGDAPRRAEFSYDQRGRYVTAEDDEARLLTGELRGAVVDEARPARRLAAVPSQDELPLGDDAIEMVRDEPDQLTIGADADWIAPDHARHDDEDGDPRDADEHVESGTSADHQHAAGEDTVEVDAPAPRRKGRAPVPTWDEIMFGGGGTRD